MRIKKRIEKVETNIFRYWWGNMLKVVTVEHKKVVKVIKTDTELSKII